MQHRKLYAGLAGLVIAGSTTVAAVQANGASTAASTTTSHNVVEAHLRPLNDSGANGHAKVRFDGKRAHFHIDARGLVKGMPHAQHLHLGQQARNECPTVADDANNDHRINVVEGVPAYGPIKKSLTTRGPVDPTDSALAVDRFPTTPQGVENYDRRITFASDKVVRAIKNGKGVIVIHGVDHNGNGKYDFAGAGPSELDPNLPAEATDPALCGVLR